MSAEAKAAPLPIRKTDLPVRLAEGNNTTSNADGATMVDKTVRFITVISTCQGSAEYTLEFTDAKNLAGYNCQVGGMAPFNPAARHTQTQCISTKRLELRFLRDGRPAEPPEGWSMVMVASYDQSSPIRPIVF